MAQSMEDTSYRLVNSEVRDLTPELAQQFRDLDPSPTERELNPARIRHLKTTRRKPVSWSRFTGRSPNWATSDSA
jgi:hypothetical protein